MTALLQIREIEERTDDDLRAWFNTQNIDPHTFTNQNVDMATSHLESMISLLTYAQKVQRDEIEHVMVVKRFFPLSLDFGDVSVSIESQDEADRMLTFALTMPRTNVAWVQALKTYATTCSMAQDAQETINGLEASLGLAIKAVNNKFVADARVLGLEANTINVDGLSFRDPNYDPDADPKFDGYVAENTMVSVLGQGYATQREAAKKPWMVLIDAEKATMVRAKTMGTLFGSLLSMARGRATSTKNTPITQGKVAPDIDALHATIKSIRGLVGWTIAGWTLTSADGETIVDLQAYAREHELDISRIKKPSGLGSLCYLYAKYDLETGVCYTDPEYTRSQAWDARNDSDNPAKGIVTKTSWKSVFTLIE